MKIEKLYFWKNPNPEIIKGLNQIRDSYEQECKKINCCYECEHFNCDETCVAILRNLTKDEEYDKLQFYYRFLRGICSQLEKMFINLKKSTNPVKSPIRTEDCTAQDYILDKFPSVRKYLNHYVRDATEHCIHLRSTGKCIFPTKLYPYACAYSEQYCQIMGNVKTIPLTLEQELLLQNEIMKIIIADNERYLGIKGVNVCLKQH